MAKPFAAIPYQDQYSIHKRHPSPMSSRMYADYHGTVPTEEYVRLQEEMEREQKRRSQAEKVTRDSTRRLRRLEDKDYSERQSNDKLKQRVRELQIITKDLMGRNKEREEYNGMLQYENETLKRRLIEVSAAGIPQNLEQEFMQLRAENKKLQQRNRSLMVHFEEERFHRDREVEELVGQLIISSRRHQSLVAELAWSQRQMQDMADWMESMREEVHHMKRAQEEEIRSGVLSPAVSITSIPNFVQKLEQSNPFQKAQELLDLMKSHNPVDLSDGASDMQSFSTEDVAHTETWSFADPSDVGSEVGDVTWPTFDDNDRPSSIVHASRNIEDRLAAVDHLLANDEDLAEKEAQEGFLDFRLLRLHDDSMLVDAVRKNLAQIRQRKQIKTPDHRIRQCIVDFTTSGYYCRFGSQELDALAAFDFLNSYPTDLPVNSDSDDQGDEGLVVSSPETLPTVSDDDVELNYTHKDDADTPVAEDGTDPPTVVSPSTPQPRFIKRKALTPDFTLQRKLDLNTPEHLQAHKHGEVSVYGTPGLRKKKFKVKASSALAEDTKVSQTDARLSMRRPKSMILMDEIISLAKTDLGMKVAADLCQNGRIQPLPSTPPANSPTPREHSKSPLRHMHKSVSDSSTPKRYVVSVTTRKNTSSQSPNRAMQHSPNHSNYTFLPTAGATTQL